jgi:hypothetical protein
MRFLYYQQDHTSIADALNKTRWCLDKNFYTEYIEQANAVSKHYCEWNQKKKNKTVISSATEQNGISWILVF